MALIDYLPQNMILQDQFEPEAETPETFQFPCCACRYQNRPDAECCSCAHYNS